MTTRIILYDMVYAVGLEGYMIKGCRLKLGDELSRTSSTEMSQTVRIVANILDSSCNALQQIISNKMAQPSFVQWFGYCGSCQ